MVIVIHQTADAQNVYSCWLIQQFEDPFNPCFQIRTGGVEHKVVLPELRFRFFLFEIVFLFQSLDDKQLIRLDYFNMTNEDFYGVIKDYNRVLAEKFRFVAEGLMIMKKFQWQNWRTGKQIFRLKK